MVSVVLGNCDRYSTLDKLYVRDTVYTVGDAIAKKLLAVADPHTGLKLFCVEGEKPDALADSNHQVKVTKVEPKITIVPPVDPIASIEAQQAVAIAAAKAKADAAAAITAAKAKADADTASKAKADAAKADNKNKGNANAARDAGKNGIPVG